MNQIDEKIHQNPLILNFFKDFFELASFTLNLIGTDFTNEDSLAQGSFIRFRKTFKIFIDLYSFLNPLEENFHDNKELNSPELHCLPKLARMQTRAPEEQKELFRVKSLTKKLDEDNSLKNSLNMAYGSFSFFVEQFIDYSLNNNNRKWSDTFLYYMKKAPNSKSTTTNIKFYYIKLVFLIFNILIFIIF